ncbi:MAG: ParB/RepB/Spo0J family partition protein [Planctomycetota bacterium]
MNIPPRRLGRGLGGLLQSTVPEPTAEEIKAADELPVEAIRANPYQPRRHFDPEALEELKASIQEHGLLQPIVVRKGPAGGYEIVAGERRFRASKLLGRTHVKAIVREVDDAGMQTLALVENLQRADLNPLEKARALKAMMSSQGLTQEGVAARVGKDRTTVANLLRLLELPEEVRVLLEDGRLTAGQAKAVLQIPGDAKRQQAAALAVEKGWSSREIERFARLAPGAKRRPAKAVDPFLRDLEERLRRALSAAVRVRSHGKGGTIEIDYADPVQLDALLDRLGAL